MFSRSVYRDIVLDSFRYAMEYKGSQLFAYIMMSSHIHLIANGSIGDLSGTIRDIKKYTSKRIIETINSIPESRRECLLNVFSRAAAQYKRNSSHQVWTHENHAFLLYSNDFITEKIEYINAFN